MGARLPELTAQQWETAATRCRPVLDIVNEKVEEVEQESLIRLATYLTLCHTDAEAVEPEAYSATTIYLNRKLRGMQRSARATLDYVQKQHSDDTLSAVDVFRLALETIATADAIVERVQSASTFTRSTAPPKKRLIWTEPKKSIPPTLAEQWQHLQRWYRENNDVARPWNVLAISKQVEFSQGVTRSLLTAPKGAYRMSSAAFSLKQLQVLQQYFPRYGYKPLA